MMMTAEAGTSSDLGPEHPLGPQDRWHQLKLTVNTLMTVTPGQRAPTSMTTRVGRNQTVGNVLDYQVYSSPIAYISNEESARGA